MSVPRLLTVAVVALALGACAPLDAAVGDPCALRVPGAGPEQEVGLDRASAMAMTTVAGVGQARGASIEEVAAVLAAAPWAPDAEAFDVGRAAAAYDVVPAAADASTVARAEALLGYHGAALTCRADRAETVREPEGPDGLTPRARTVRVAIGDTFGELPVGGFAPGGVSTGHREGSAHYDGLAVDVFFRPVEEANRRRGWAVAQWLTAHAERLDVATVIFDDRIWSTRRSGQGWRDYGPYRGDTDNEVLRHLDHVHVDVVG